MAFLKSSNNMKKIIPLLVIIILSLPVFLSAAVQDDENEGFSYYKKLNDSEKRLPEYKDSDGALLLKVKQLAVINASRERYHAGIVKLDILASRVANKQCREAAENDYLSHWNLAGEKPYVRYALAGGYDHVSENAYSQGTTAEFGTGAEETAKLMKDGHESFMSEKAPYDGHKRNDINKTHNYVGLGFYTAKGEFRYNEEFIDRYLEFTEVPAVLKPGEQGALKLDTKGNCFLYFMTVYREDIPKPMTKARLGETGSYGDFTEELVINKAPWDLNKLRNGSVYNIPLSFPKEGLYYIHIYTDKKEYSGYGSVSTDGKDPVSGIVIRVSR
jgi:hypothetical protein